MGCWSQVQLGDRNHCHVASSRAWRNEATFRGGRQAIASFCLQPGRGCQTEKAAIISCHHCLFAVLHDNPLTRQAHTLPCGGRDKLRCTIQAEDILARTAGDGIQAPVHPHCTESLTRQNSSASAESATSMDGPGWTSKEISLMPKKPQALGDRMTRLSVFKLRGASNITSSV